MLQRFHTQLRRDLVAHLALFFALSGTAFAAKPLITGADVKDGALTGAQGWAEPVEFMHHCSTKWGVFLVGLKQLLETGTGSPAPHDTHIDNRS